MSEPEYTETELVAIGEVHDLAIAQLTAIQPLLQHSLTTPDIDWFKYE